MIVLVLLSLIGYAVWLTDRWRWPIESVLLPLVSMVMAAIYVGGLAGWLRPTAWSVLALGIALGAETLRRRRSTLPPLTLRPGIAVFSLAFSMACLWLGGSSFHGNDEFSHWGLVTRQIVQTDGLVTADSPVMFKDYPPATGLFHYFWMLGAPMREDAAYLAHAVLALAAMAVLWTSRNWGIVALAAVVACGALFTFLGGPQTLNVDHLVGLFFGCGLAGYLISTDRGRVYRLLPVLFVLPLIKRVGLPLSLFAAAAVACDQLLFDRRDRARLAVLALLFLSPLAASYSWAWHMTRLNVSHTHAVRATNTDLKRAFSSSATPRDTETIDNFRHALAHTSVGSTVMGPFFHIVTSRVGIDVITRGGLSFWRWAAVYGVLFTLICLIQPSWTSVRRIGVFHLWFALCAASYVFGLLVLYLFAFSPYEGPRLASYSRYVGTLLLGSAIVLLAWVLVSRRSGGWRHGGAIALLLFLATGMVYTMDTEAVRFARHGVIPVPVERTAVQESLATAGTLPTRARIYFVWQGTVGFELYIARYELAPRRTNEWCWSLGAPRFDGDVWTCAQTADEWANVLMNYDYVVLGHTDEAFWSDFSVLFDEPRQGAVYEVVNAGGVTRLRAHI